MILACSNNIIAIVAIIAVAVVMLVALHYAFREDELREGERDLEG